MQSNQKVPHLPVSRPLAVTRIAVEAAASLSASVETPALHARRRHAQRAIVLGTVKYVRICHKESDHHHQLIQQSQG